jgi:hypothetical protein
VASRQRGEVYTLLKVVNEEFEDTKDVTRSGKSQNKQFNDQKKCRRSKGQTIINKIQKRKVKIKKHEPH